MKENKPLVWALGIFLLIVVAGSSFALGAAWGRRRLARNAAAQSGRPVMRRIMRPNWPRQFSPTSSRSAQSGV
ncbi:MAG: hypothetical protein M1484_00855 [Patescibacteria group bacterium]|nr:hypothetical protein [Patescibacteria group bacterium]MCL5431628.1 hypothetical protein [Patescibacteria group bacterium]